MFLKYFIVCFRSVKKNEGSLMRVYRFKNLIDWLIRVSKAILYALQRLV